MNTKQAAALKTLTKARKLLARTQGWVKGSQHIEKGATISSKTHELRWDGDVILKMDAYCAWGAICKADGPGENLAVRLLIQGIRVLRGLAPAKDISKASLNEDYIFKFNDAKKRTKDEVLAAFDAAIQMIDVDA